MVRHISYKGKELPILITFFSLFRTEEETGKSLDEKSTYKEFETLFYYALLEGHDFEDLEFDISKHKAALILGSVFKQFKDFIPEFMAAIAEQSTDESEAKKK